MLYIVFDFDGTLADTQRHHAQVESDFLKQQGIEISASAITEKYAGRTPREWLAEILTEHTLSFDEHVLEAFETHKNEKIVAIAKE